MNRQRDQREAKALNYIKRHRIATALDIGSAAVEGERRWQNIPLRGRESIGLSIAIALLRRGILRATTRNSFMMAHGPPWSS
jgi:hypothetical protein